MEGDGLCQLLIVETVLSQAIHSLLHRFFRTRQERGNLDENLSGTSAEGSFTCCLEVWVGFNWVLIDKQQGDHHTGTACGSTTM